MNSDLTDSSKMLIAIIGALIVLLAAAAAADGIHEPDPSGTLGLDVVGWQSPGTGDELLTTVPRSVDESTAEHPPIGWFHQKGRVGSMVATLDIPIIYSPLDDDIAWTYNVGPTINGWFAAVAEAGAIDVPY